MAKMQMDLLRECSVSELSAVFRQETRYWEQELFWDYESTLRILSSFIASRTLPGFVLRNDGDVVGYCYYVIDAPVAFLGNVYVLDEFVGELSYVPLVEHAIAAMRSSSRIARIEAQVFSFNRDLTGLFQGHGFEAMPRGFLVRRLDDVPEVVPEVEPSKGCRLISWQDRYLAAAADVVFDSYVLSYDARICRDYQTRRGCLRFIRNLIENPACGKFSRSETLLAVDQKGSLCGLLLATRISDSTGMIPQLSVRRESQGRGLGGLLLRTYFSKCRQSGLDRVALSVSEANVRALKLYRRMGFEVRKQFHAYVWEG